MNLRQKSLYQSQFGQLGIHTLILAGVWLGLSRIADAQIPEPDWQNAVLQTAISPDERQDESVDGLLVRAKMLAGQGNLMEAIALYHEAANQDSRNASIFSAIGYLQTQLGNSEQAIAAFQQAINLEPNNGDYCYALGFNLARLGDLPGAIKAYRQAIELNLNHINGYISLGLLYTQQQNYRQAILTYLPALILEPNNPSIYEAVGFTYAQMGQYEDAVEFLQRAAQLASRQVEPQDLLSSALFKFK